VFGYHGRVSGDTSRCSFDQAFSSIVDTTVNVDGGNAFGSLNTWVRSGTFDAIMRRHRIAVATVSLRLGSLAFALPLAGCAAQPPAAPAATDDGAQADAVMAAIGEDPQDRLPGYAGAVGVGDGIVYSSAAGLAEVDVGRAATPQTRFRIYSTSKSIGAVAAMVLVESGKLDLDAPISTYLPDLPVPIGVVTVRQILAHRSGIRHYREGEWDSVSDSNCAAPKDALPDFVNDPLEFAPGSAYKYSTFGYQRFWSRLPDDPLTSSCARACSNQRA
jgi:hypothetical protein